jgi:hypothetical protein
MMPDNDPSGRVYALADLHVGGRRRPAGLGVVAGSKVTSAVTPSRLQRARPVGEASCFLPGTAIPEHDAQGRDLGSRLGLQHGLLDQLRWELEQGCDRRRRVLETRQLDDAALLAAVELSLP